MAEKQARGELTYEQVYEDATAYHHTMMQAQRRQTWFLFVSWSYYLEEALASVLRPYLLFIKELFQDIFEPSIPVGQFSSANITKNEPVLNGESVVYSDSL